MTNFKAITFVFVAFFLAGCCAAPPECPRFPEPSSSEERVLPSSGIGRRAWFPMRATALPSESMDFPGRLPLPFMDPALKTPFSLPSGEGEYISPDAMRMEVSGRMAIYDGAKFTIPDGAWYGYATMLLMRIGDNASVLARNGHNQFHLEKGMPLLLGFREVGGVAVKVASLCVTPDSVGGAFNPLHQCEDLVYHDDIRGPYWSTKPPDFEAREMSKR